MVTLDLSPSFVASIARALNSAQVPCVLWGQYLLNVHGVPSIIHSLDFVIPDELVKVGTDTLLSINTLRPCPRGPLCPSSSDRRHTPAPTAHFHIGDSDVNVSLYLQSETLWFLPPIDQTLLSPRSADLPTYLLLASDERVLPEERPGRGSGVFPSTVYPVIIIRAVTLLEAYVRLYIRDLGTRMGTFGMAMITYMGEYVEDDGYLDEDQLPEPIRTFYVGLKVGEKPTRQYTAELKNALEANSTEGKLYATGLRSWQSDKLVQVEARESLVPGSQEPR